MKIAIIGGGAAGFFAAISAKTNYPKSTVIIFEKSTKLLSKVKISGGGRCNVTNGCQNHRELLAGYPRGAKKLKKAFRIFDNKDTYNWFEARGVALKTEADNRVFPISDNSQSIIDCLMKEVDKLGIEIRLKSGVKSIYKENDQLVIQVNEDLLLFDKVIIASGGSPKKEGLNWIAKLGHTIQPPVPSLFTFNMPKDPILKLMGVVAPNATASIQGSKLKSNGPLLITHWGMSGPAILKLSSFGARLLSDASYRYNIQVNWISITNHDQVINELNEIVDSHPKKHVSNIKPFDLTERLWTYLLEKCEISPDKPWLELGKKNINKLVNILTHDIYAVNGKTTFKEEFVTCGGVGLSDIDITTMQSKVISNLYFAGEVVDIDGITGGYNFQAAWTTGYIAGMLK